GIALEQPLQAPERSAAEVAAGVELVPRGCRMDVVDAEAHRCPLSGGQPRVMFDERHRGRGHGALPEPVTRVAAIGSFPMAAFLAGGLVILLLFGGRGHVRMLAIRQWGCMLCVGGPGSRLSGVG